jgi:hypothetical protein
MKRIINFFLVTVLLILTTNSAISSTEVTITGVKQTVVYRVYDSGGTEYEEESLTGNDIGTAYSSQFEMTESCRTLFRFDLSSIPTGVTINSVVLFFQNSASTQYSQVFTEAVSKSSISEQWSEIAGADMLFDDPISYGSNNITSSYLTDLIVGDIGGYSYIGAFSTDEDQTDSFSGLTLKVTVNYGTTQSVLNITAKNKMDAYEGGDIKVGVDTVAAHQTSPHSFTAQINNAINLGAIENQSHNGYNWIWNDTEALSNNSEWTQFDGSGTFFKSYDQNYSFTAAGSDDGTDYIANLRKVCNVTFSNQFSGTSNGGSIEINGVTQTAPYTANVVDENNITAEADNHDINGIRYIFRRWSVTETNRVLNLTVTSHTSKTAEYLGIPIFNEAVHDGNLRNLVLSAGAGNKVKLTWNEHPNQYITKYYVYRRIKNPDGSLTDPVHIATRNRGTLTFTDVEYTYQPGTGDYGLYYDVQAYYSLEGTNSSGAYKYIEGDQSGVLTKDNSENNTQNLIVTNYDIGNFPNPFNPTTRINYQLPEQGHVTIKVYDMLGKEVAELVNETKESGIYNVNFDAGNLSSGVYVYMINVDATDAKSKGYLMSKKMLMMK